MVKAIFCINPGRSGSHYLSGLLEESENCDSHHEAPPHGFGKPMQAYQQGAPAQMQDVADAIARAIQDSHDAGRIYADTSHGFIKGFGWLLMEQVAQEDIGIVILKRDKDDMVHSTFRAHSGPMKNLGRRYTLTPDRMNPIHPPPGFLGLGARPGYALARGLHGAVMFARKVQRRLGLAAGDAQLFEEYQKQVIGWYWDETYALGDAFRQKFPNCSYFETGTEDLNDTENVLKLFSQFGVTPTQALLDKIGVPTNLKV